MSSAAALGLAGGGGSGSSGGGGGGRSWWAGAPAAAAAAAAATAACVPSAAADAALPPADAGGAGGEQGDGVRAGGKLLALPVRQRIFFKYEKRIRDRSSLEKIFEYFATHEHEHGKAMSSQDVVRALVPTYPPVGTDVERAGYLDGERGHSKDSARSVQHQLLQFFDHDGDGTIGFNEFVLIVILLSVPEKDIGVVFDVMDLDNNGVIDEQEFTQVLEQLERRAGIQPSFHNRAGKHNHVDPGNKDAAHKLFQEGDGVVHLSRFRTFLQRLQEGMLQLEFAHYDTKGSGRICGADFAHSLVTAADVRLVDRYLDRVDSMPPELAGAQISMAEFAAMAALRRNLHMLSFALDFCSQIQRPLLRGDFSKLVQKTVGVALPPRVLDVLFHLFGDEERGGLDGPAFVDVMKRRNRVPGYKRGRVDEAGEPSGSSNTPVVDWLSCIGKCTFGGGGSSAP